MLSPLSSSTNVTVWLAVLLSLMSLICSVICKCITEMERDQFAGWMPFLSFQLSLGVSMKVWIEWPKHLIL